MIFPTEKKAEKDILHKKISRLLDTLPAATVKAILNKS